MLELDERKRFLLLRIDDVKGMFLLGDLFVKIGLGPPYIRRRNVGGGQISDHLQYLVLKLSIHTL